MPLDRTRFGKVSDGREVELFTLSNSHGVSVKIITYGGRIVELHVPDKQGNRGNIILGFDNLAQYLRDELYFGPIVGRYALRIAGGEFVLDGVRYELPKNEKGNTLHGGPRGFDRQLWQADPLQLPDGVALRLTYFSPHLQDGFPGDLTVSVTYALNERNEFQIRYIAHTDRPTPVSFTNHIYFNLCGAGAKKILDHRIAIHAPDYLPTDSKQLPTGEVASVADSALDLNEGARIGDRLGKGKANIEGGFDHWYVLGDARGISSRCVRVEEPGSGRALELATDWPGLEFYTSNKLDGSVHGIGGEYTKQCAFTLEPMNYPDAMHHANFPSSILVPGQTLDRQTVYRFSML